MEDFIKQLKAAEKERDAALDRITFEMNRGDQAYNAAIEKATGAIKGVVIRNGNEFMVGEIVDNIKSQLAAAIRELKR
ncbi:MAG: hypothetical protein V3S69_01970 [Dehalococcoidales bacterium]